MAIALDAGDRAAEVRQSGPHLKPLHQPERRRPPRTAALGRRHDAHRQLTSKSSLKGDALAAGSEQVHQTDPWRSRSVSTEEGSSACRAWTGDCLLAGEGCGAEGTQLYRLLPAQPRVLPALTDHGVRGGGPVASGVRLRAPRQQGSSAALAIRHRLAAVAVGPTHAHAYSTTKARMARCGSPRPADRQRRTTHPRAADMGGIRWRRRPGDYERSGCVRRHVPRCGRRAQATPTRRRTP